MIFFYEGGALMSLIEIPGITNDMAEWCQPPCPNIAEYYVTIRAIVAGRPNPTSKRCESCAHEIQDQYLDGVVELEPWSHERWYGGRWFVCESLSRKTAEWMVNRMRGLLLPAPPVPPTRLLNPGKQIGKYGKIEIGSTGVYRRAEVPEGWSLWAENGVWYTAPQVDKDKFNGHAYAGVAYDMGVRDCPCGCSMHDSSSWGPVNPFGPCPMNPKSEFVKYLTHDLDDPDCAWRWANKGLCPICGSVRRGLACLCRYCPRCNCHYLTEIYALGTVNHPKYQFCSLDKDYAEENGYTIESYLIGRD